MVFLVEAIEVFLALFELDVKVVQFGVLVLMGVRVVLGLIFRVTRFFGKMLYFVEVLQVYFLG